MIANRLQDIQESIGNNQMHYDQAWQIIILCRINGVGYRGRSKNTSPFGKRLHENRKDAREDLKRISEGEDQRSWGMF